MFGERSESFIFINQHFAYRHKALISREQAQNNIELHANDREKCFKCDNHVTLKSYFYFQLARIGALIFRSWKRGVGTTTIPEFFQI